MIKLQGRTDRLLELSVLDVIVGFGQRRG
jgi:hypothetical protein